PELHVVAIAAVLPGALVAHHVATDKVDLDAVPATRHDESAVLPAASIPVLVEMLEQEAQMFGRVGSAATVHGSMFVERLLRQREVGETTERLDRGLGMTPRRGIGPRPALPDVGHPLGPRELPLSARLGPAAAVAPRAGIGLEPVLGIDDFEACRTHRGAARTSGARGGTSDPQQSREGRPERRFGREIVPSVRTLEALQ